MRPGFQRLLSAVCLEDVGGVFALEASRLARNNRDWHQLVELCGLTSTLIIDAEGVYDPHHFNDRLLLGLKGTMSEWELGVMRQRSLVALREKAETRGTLYHAGAYAYVRTRTETTIVNGQLVRIPTIPITVPEDSDHVGGERRSIGALGSG